MFRSKKKKLIHQQLDRRGLLDGWWQVAEAAIAQCEKGDPLEPMLSGAGPIPARSLVALLGLEPFVEGGVDWTLYDENTEPGNAFYAPNNDMTMPSSEEGKRALQEWFFPTGGPEGHLGLRDQQSRFPDYPQQ
jgi:hypothetical protein